MIINNIQFDKEDKIVLDFTDKNDTQFRPVCIVGDEKNDIIDEICYRYKTITRNIFQATYEYLIQILNEKHDKSCIYLCKDVDSFLTLKQQFLLFSKIRKKSNVGFIFSSNTAFLISDCLKDDVYIFDKKSKIKKPNFQTFGSSVNLINMKILGMKHTISKRAMDYLHNIKGYEDIREDKIGDSIEKTLCVINFERKK
jgi:hypothetical protein